MIKRLKKYAALFLASAMLISGAGCGSKTVSSGNSGSSSMSGSGVSSDSGVSQENMALSEGSEYLFKINDKAVNNLTYGIGWNITPYNFSPTGKVLEKYMDLLEWTSPDLIRYATDMVWWAPDKDYKKNLNDQKISYLTKMTDQFEKREIPYFLANWKNGAKWLSEIPGEQNCGVTDAKTFGEVYAALFSYLLNEKQYKYLKGFSFWNEPGFGYKSEKYKYPEKFFSMYPIVDQVFKDYGIRDRVEFFGNDDNDHFNSDFNLKNFSDITEKTSQSISFHDYSTFSDYNPSKCKGESISSRIKRLKEYKQQIREIYGKDIPIIIGEFGNWGDTWRADKLNQEQMYTGALSLAEMMIRFSNAGVNGFLQWSFNKYMDSYRVGPIQMDYRKNIIKVCPIPYYLNAIFSRYIMAESDIYDSVMVVDKDKEIEDSEEYHHVYLSFMKLPDGNYTITIVNSGNNDKTIDLDISAIKDLADKKLNNLYISRKTIDKGILAGDNVKMDNGKLIINIKGRSVHSVTTCDPGNLDFPTKGLSTK